MNTVKLMVVNATQEKDRKYVGETFSAIKAWPFSGNDHEIITGSLKGYVVNPIDIDEDLTIRVGSGQDDILFHLRKVSKASPRKLLVRAMKRIAKERGYTNAYIRKFGTFAGVGDWARAWADWYFDKYGEFNSVYVDWMHDTEHDPVNGDEWRDFIESELDAL
ncbi:hypothetical protein [Enterobacter phage F20]|uniref:Uncharacterized protein n=1 Tax=Enterobacter phage F20 TaxID=2886900 RepID=G5DML0_9CAUD|nr:hypothetical protein FLA17_gp65 [Enterobacter phage F20]AEQ39238.1 hypothetical protein [Enterobacter phage F20]